MTSPSPFPGLHLFVYGLVTLTAAPAPTTDAQNLSEATPKIRAARPVHTVRKKSMSQLIARTAAGAAACGLAGFATLNLVPRSPIYADKFHDRPPKRVRPDVMHVSAGRRVAKDRFRKGDYWVWLYRDGAGNPSNWEKYSVRDCSGDEVLIDMASKQGECEEYQVHHRMHVSLAEALAASDDKSQWNLRKFGFIRDGKWLEAPYRDNVQAFEEKFDGFLMATTPTPDPHADVPAANTRLTKPAGGVRERLLDVEALGEATLVRTPRNTYTGAWYVSSGHRNAGVAAFKAFGKEGQPGTYTFELVGFGTREDSLDTEGQEPILRRV